MNELATYLLDAAIVLSYLGMVLGLRPARDFHWANALCGPFLVVNTIASVGWTPILVLTITFTIAGWIGVLKGQHHA